MKDQIYLVSNGALIPASPSANEFLSSRDNGAKVVLNAKPAKRSLDQNAMVHAMYAQLAQAMEWTTREMTHHCKLQFGVPILRRDDPEFAEWTQDVLIPLTYEQRLKAMEYLPVTRIMSKKQMTEYIDDIIMDFSSQGVPVVLPGDHVAA